MNSPNDEDFACGCEAPKFYDACKFPLGPVPHVEFLHTRRTALLLEKPYAYCWRMEIICIPAGTITDGVSGPAILGRDNGQRIAAAIVHDWAYMYHSVPVFNKVEFNYRHQRINRREADALFYRVLTDAGYNKFLAWTMYLGLRIGGSWPWHSHKQDIKKWKWDDWPLPPCEL